MSEEKWWFGFRQTTPKPPGRAIACGPYESYEKAKAERERSKAWDCEVSTPFAANSKDEQMTGSVLTFQQFIDLWSPLKDHERRIK